MAVHPMLTWAEMAQVIAQEHRDDCVCPQCDMMFDVYMESLREAGIR
jgi:hypothetical protein